MASKNELLDLVHRLRETPIRLCLSCKSFDWSDFVIDNGRSFNRLAASIYPIRHIEETNQLRSISSPDPTTIGIWLQEYADDELEATFSKYKQVFLLQGQLQATTRSECRIPLILRLLADVWRGRNRDIPPEISQREVFDWYWMLQMSKVRQKFAAERWLSTIARLSVESGYRQVAQSVLFEELAPTDVQDEIYHDLVRYGLLRVTPPHADAQFVWHMEDVLEVYPRPFDSRFPQLCRDESGKQLISDKLEGLPMQPGQPERSDYSYEQGPMLNLFLACEPLAGKRMVKVTEQKTSQDWAHFMQEVIDVQYPNAEQMVLVMDNLATHSPAALYHAFPPAEACRLASKLEIHHTPLHGSWLNMAEIEFATLARQCLSRRIATKKELEHQVACWQEQRNAAATTVNWRFTTADARIKLKRLYPSLKAKTTNAESETVANDV